jgi:hypothetical protein
LAKIHPDGRPVQPLDALPDQEITPLRPGEGQERHEPQDKLGRVDLVGEDEGGHDQEGQLRNPRPPRGSQGKDRNKDARKQEHIQGERVDGLRSEKRPVHPPGNEVIGKPRRAVAGGAVLRELEEVLPAGRVPRGDGQVDGEPGCGGRCCRDYKSTDLPGAQGQQEDGAKDQDGVELGGSPQADQDAGQDQPLPGQEIHAKGQHGHGPHVPVDHSGKDDAGRQGHHGCVPGPPPGHAGSGEHGDDPDGGDQGRVNIEVAEDPGVRDSLAGHQAGRDAGDQAHQDRILEEGTRGEERKSPVAQAPVAEQLREIRIAGRVELRRRLPAVHPAVVLDGDGSEGGEHGQDDQHAFHCEEAGRDHARRRPLAQGPADELGEVPQEPVAAARHHQARELSIGRWLCLLHGLELTGGSLLKRREPARSRAGSLRRWLTDVAHQILLIGSNAWIRTAKGRQFSAGCSSADA